jgi:hypothetical protein
MNFALIGGAIAIVGVAGMALFAWCLAKAAHAADEAEQAEWLRDNIDSGDDPRIAALFHRDGGNT